MSRAQVDDGNPTSGPKTFNPHARAWGNTSHTRTHFARSWAEEVVSWGPQTANMYKVRRWALRARARFHAESVT